MDEHDKRAREVVQDEYDRQAVNLLTKALQDLTSGDEVRCLAAYDSIASALRSTAAVAAERERCRAIAAEFGADEAWHPERRHAAASIADAISVATAPLASPAQAERVSEELERARREWADDARVLQEVSAGLRKRAVEAEAEAATLRAVSAIQPTTCAACLKANKWCPWRDDEIGYVCATCLRDRTEAASQHRLAARLRARADEAQARAERLDVTAETRGTPEQERQSAGRVADLNHALAFALRAEADALEVGT